MTLVCIWHLEISKDKFRFSFYLWLEKYINRDKSEALLKRKLLK